MASLEELRNVRIGKKELLESKSISSYPESIPRTISLPKLKESFLNLTEQDALVVHSICGRVVSVRGQGAILFVTLLDENTKFQVVIKKDVVGDDVLNLFASTVDIGDFVSFTGTLFVTQKGENSLLAQSFVMATKSLLPLPEKYHGLEDIDEIRRKRYLEMITDPDAYTRMLLRSKIVTYVRKFFDTRDFIEVETPILQSQAGGAMAKTFNTYHNDYKMDMVLRIALELEHKMIMAGGFPRVYEIGKNFRNEGSDPTHIQEFTMIEWYAAYATLDQNMAWTEELLKSLAKDIIGQDTFTVYDKDGNGQEVSFTGVWPKVRFPDLLKQNAGIDMVVASMDEIKACAKKFGMDDKEIAITGKGNLLDFIFKKSSRINIIAPTFVMDYPSELKPLAQQNTDGTAKVYQLIIGGAEICNAYAELVDPTVQRKLLEDQALAKEGGDEEAMDVDERFLTAMEHGMPPMTGFGMGIDRLVAILTNQKNLRDTIFFPIVREKE